MATIDIDDMNSENFVCANEFDGTSYRNVEAGVSEATDSQDVIGIGSDSLEKIRFTKTLVVEKIVDVSFSQEGHRVYCVRWEETWEREEDLIIACKDLLREFWEHQLASAQVDPERVEPNDKNATHPEMPTKATQTGEHRTAQVELSELIAMLPQTSKNAQEQKQVKLTKDIPEPYKKIGFAKSVREKFSEELPSESNYDYVEQILQKQSASKKSRPVPKTPREDAIQRLVSFKNGTRVSCNICWESFADKKSLQRHMICRHDKFSPHQCVVCQKMFIKPSDVRRHMAAHTTVRMHFCHICSKSYKTKNHLHRHWKTKHKGVAPETDDGMDQTLQEGEECFLQISNESSQLNSDEPLQLSGDEHVHQNSDDSSQQNLVNLVQEESEEGTFAQEVSNVNGNVLHPVTINGADLLLQDTTAVLHNANVILHNHPSLTEHFLTRTDGIQMCLIDRPFF